MTSDTPMCDADVRRLKGAYCEDDDLIQAAYSMGITTANETIARLERELAIAEIKNAGTLANNLCPDHRDKQVGQPCLACTIETLNRKLATKEAVAHWNTRPDSQP